MSEGFAFCVMSKMFDIDVLVESGVGGGRSTEIFANFLTCHIIGVENCSTHGAARFNETKKRLSRYGNVSFIHGDSRIVVPELLANMHGKRVGLFVDGPKGQDALDLAQKCCLENPEVLFVGIHDMCEKFYNHLMDSWDATVFYTDWETFRNQYGFLDGNDFDWRFSSGARLGDNYANGFVTGFAVNQLS